MVGKIVKTISASDKHSGDATCLLYHADHLYSGGADGKIKIWDRNLQLKKEIQAHESYIYAIAINSKGELYSSSCDETIRWFPAPHHSNNYEIILRNDIDQIITLIVANDDTLYSGDDKGIVTKWNGNKIGLMYNLVEEIRSLQVDGNLLYTARDLDVVITQITNSQTGRYFTKGTIPGRCPVLLFGPNENERKKFIIFSTRDGKGIGMVENKSSYNGIWTKENAHEMIINCFCATQTILYSAGYDGRVKKWVELENGPQNAGEVNIGCCVNTICMGGDSENMVYVGDANGMINCISFSSKAA